MSIRDTAKPRFTTTQDPDGYPVSVPKKTKKERIADLELANGLLRSMAEESRLLILLVEPGKDSILLLDKKAHDFTVDQWNDRVEMHSAVGPISSEIIGGEITIRWR